MLSREIGRALVFWQMNRKSRPLVSELSAIQFRKWAKPGAAAFARTKQAEAWLTQT